ncbi:hypothetical protein HDF16_006145 [Granulicella aggregans]|uniref:Uncharacterized protein n=1 Tax=Granulicella aggregans TaxID=474949 RepID=A0A7W7ZKS9_9BACT|nr:hypothetical protein [Granulicella aggregans]
MYSLCHERCSLGGGGVASFEKISKTAPGGRASVSVLDTYRVKDKEVEEASPVYGGASSGSVLWAVLGNLHGTTAFRYGESR